MKLFTVVVSPRYATHGTASYGLFRSREAAQVEMERRVREELEDDGTYDDEEIEEYIREAFHEIEGVRINNMKLVSEDI